MQDDLRADAMDFCRDRAAQAWTVYWRLIRAGHPRRAAATARLWVDRVAAVERSRRWVAAAALVGVASDSWFGTQTRHGRVGLWRPGNRTAGEARRKMAEGPYPVRGEGIRVRFRAAKN